MKRKIKRIKIESLELPKIDESAIIKRHQEYKDSLTLEYQLGYYIGEAIERDYLPTLSIDLLKSRKVIPVSPEETEQYDKIKGDWFSTTKHGANWDGVNDYSREKWDAFIACRKKLEKKYLPEKLVCHMNVMNVENLEELKKGIISALWNSDICSYNTNPEKIKIYDDAHLYFTIVELELDV